jgi:hypothetical protein
MPEVSSKEEHENTYYHKEKKKVGLVALFIPDDYCFVKKKRGCCQIGKFKEFGKFHHCLSSSKI